MGITRCEKCGEAYGDFELPHGCPAATASEEQRGRERIVAAALVREGVTYSVPQPGRHDAVISEACRQLDLPSIGAHEQGFVTSYGRFVNRYVAARIAHKAGQTTTLLRMLTSEDVW